MKQYKYTAPDDLMALVRKQAHAEHVSEAQIVRRALRHYLALSITTTATDTATSEPTA